MQLDNRVCSNLKYPKTKFSGMNFFPFLTWIQCLGTLIHHVLFMMPYLDPENYVKLKQ